MQHYEDDKAYSERDVEFLSSVGGQIAVAIERKQAEEALLASEERYRELFERSVMGASITTVAGKIVACNAAFAKILGFESIAELLPSNMVSIYKREQDREALLELLRKERKLENYELELCRRDGTPICVAENVTGVFDESGKLVELHSHLLDITERKHAEADVVMPRMGGRELAERLAELRPETRVIFISGYTDDAIVRHGIMAKDIAFLQKPFTHESLARKVCEVLERPI